MLSHFCTTVAAAFIALAGTAQAETTEVPLAFNNGVYFALATVNGTATAAFIVDISLSKLVHQSPSRMVRRQPVRRSELVPLYVFDRFGEGSA